nr:MAG TPA: hypothetical protein [Caudoviricetes sp.]
MKAIGFGYNDELGINGSKSKLKPYKFGSFDFYVDHLANVIIDTNDKGAAFFNSYENQQAFILEYHFKNNSKYKTDFEPENFELTTPSGDKVQPMNNVSTYYGINRFVKPNESNKGVAWFILNDKDEKVDKILLYVDSPISTDPNADQLDGKSFNFQILNVRDSVKKDYTD